MNVEEDLQLEHLWESGGGSVLVHVVLNDLGLIGSAVRTLQDGWSSLSRVQRQQLLGIIGTAADRGVDRLRLIALTG